MGRTDPRRQQILSILEETGTLNVTELADRFGVSVVTIRKDLDDLGAEGLLERTFGGAIFSHRSRFNISFLQRAQEHRQEKLAIAARRFRIHQRRRHNHPGCGHDDACIGTTAKRAG
jgi:DeoR/GlpR family transcriptional regulator of sugar metabolism